MMHLTLAKIPKRRVFCFYLHMARGLADLNNDGSSTNNPWHVHAQRKTGRSHMCALIFNTFAT